VESL
jgi:FtsZ-binding cell division protein ZapB